jgi:hypothetical protein
MGMVRIQRLKKISIIGSRGELMGTLPIEGRLALPLSIEMPRTDAEEKDPVRSEIFHLSICMGELSYLHENVPIAR